VIKELWTHRQLIKKMAWREVIGRYKGSVMGLVWSFFYPLVLLVVYTFVFTVIFNARWENQVDGMAGTGVIFFTGLIIYNLFAEIVGGSPILILGRVNYVKKVVFPLQIIPLATVLSACFHAAISIVVLLLFYFIKNMELQATLLFFPFILLPYLLFLLGCSWIIASLGVYFRDMQQIIGLLVTVMMFLTPIFYPKSVIPEAFQTWIYLNPLTFIVEQSRDVLIFGNMPDWFGLLIYYLFSTAFAFLGYAWFQKIRHGFADVI
jgi:lipopolysaccharide transport system permease protein